MAEDRMASISEQVLRDALPMIFWVARAVRWSPAENQRDLELLYLAVCKALGTNPLCEPIYAQEPNSHGPIHDDGTEGENG